MWSEGSPSRRGSLRFVCRLLRQELLERIDVGLEGRLDDVGGQAVAGHRLTATLGIGRAARAHSDLALRILATGDRPDLIVHELGMPAEDRLDCAVDGTEQRVDGTVAGAL